MDALPVQRRPPRATLPSKDQDTMVGVEITKLRQKGAVVPVEPTAGQFVSRIFTVPKKGGATRPVVNLRPLNRFIIRKHFKMEGTTTLRELIKKGDWMTSVDLKDAFLSVPIHASHRKFLRFRWWGAMFEFQCLPFGLTSAPRVFTKLMKPVMAVLRRRSIRCMIFIDDVLLLSQSKEELSKITTEFTLMLHCLGFLVNVGKSVLTPSQSLTYLGFHLNTVEMTLSLPKEKLEAIIQSCSSTMSKPSVTVRELAKVIGRMSAAVQAILPAPLYYRGLQNLKNTAFRSSGSYDTEITLDSAAIQDLVWWSQEVRKWNSRPIRDELPQMVIDSDASLVGWGASTNQMATGGLWTPAERRYHINVLEMMAGAFAVKTFAKDGGESLHIRLRMDNTTAVAYVNHLGGTRSPLLAKTTRDLWTWCLSRGITISAEYLPGVENVTADLQSRIVATSAEWMMDPQVFQALVQVLGPCKVDLFATRLNAQLDRYVSWRPDPFAISTDAFQIPWQKLLGYAFPPFCLIGRCLKKVQQEGSTILLVAPVWVHQPWYPLLLGSLIEVPVLLPQSINLLRDPFGQPHPLHSLRLAGWKVSGEGSLQRAFRAKLQTSLQQAGVKEPTRHTSQRGPSGAAGVCNGIWIPFQEV